MGHCQQVVWRQGPRAAVATDEERAASTRAIRAQAEESRCEEGDSSR